LLANAAEDSKYSDGKNPGQLYKAIVNLLFLFPGNLSWGKNDLAVHFPGHHIAFSAEEGFDSGRSKFSGEDPVPRARAAAPLNVAENSNSVMQMDKFAHSSGKIDSAAVETSFCYDDDAASLTAPVVNFWR